MLELRILPRSLRIGLLGLGLVAAACSSGGTAAPTIPSGAPSPDSVVSSLGKVLTAEGASYRLHVVARISVGVVFNYDITMAVSGKDLQVTIDMSSGSMSYKVWAVALGGKGYAKVGETTEWAEIDVSSVDSMGDAWTDLLDPKYYAFDRLEGEGSSIVYVFVNKAPIPYTAEDNATIKWSDLTLTDCVLKVKTDGTPVTFQAKETGRAVLSGQMVQVNGTLDYTFSDVGSPIVIESPV